MLKRYAIHIDIYEEKIDPAEHLEGEWMKAADVEQVLKEVKSFLTSVTLTQPHDPGDYLKTEAQALLAHLKEPA